MGGGPIGINSRLAYDQWLFCVGAPICGIIGVAIVIYARLLCLLKPRIGKFAKICVVGRPRYCPADHHHNQSADAFGV